MQWIDPKFQYPGRFQRFQGIGVLYIQPALVLPSGTQGRKQGAVEGFGGSGGGVGGWGAYWRSCGTQLQSDLHHINRLDQTGGQHPAGTSVDERLSLLPYSLCCSLGLRELGLQLVCLLSHLVCHFG